MLRKEQHTPRDWLLVASSGADAELRRVIRACGHRIINPAPSSGGITAVERGDYAETPDAVLLDHTADKLGYAQALFWRGVGIPVVFVGTDTGKSGRRAGVLRMMGCVCLPSVSHLPNWLRSRPRYLSELPVRTEEELNREVILARLSENPLASTRPPDPPASPQSG